MKTLLYLSAFLFILPYHAFSCAWYDPETEYFNLFQQDVIDNTSYYPFLLTYDTGFKEVYDYVKQQDVTPYQPLNENILQWQKMFGNKMTYDEVKTWLYDSSADDFTKNGRKKSDFKKYYKKIPSGIRDEVLDYMLIAKELEPYAQNNLWYEYSWDDDKNKENDDFSSDDYAQWMIRLQGAYKNATNEEIKLRYGYQMVRLAHYNWRFDEAEVFFNRFVKPHNDGSAIYYYALEQYGGALNAMDGRAADATKIFLEVFTHCTDRRKSAYMSVVFNRMEQLEEIIPQLKEDEQMALYFILGRMDYTDPTYAMEKMIEINPNHDLLQVITVRAINQLERIILGLAGGCANNYFYEDEAYCTSKGNILPAHSTTFDYLNRLTNLIQKISENSNLNASNKGFYQLTMSYLKYLQKDYTGAEQLLKKADLSNDRRKEQAKKLELLILITKQEKITSAFENELFTKYPWLFNPNDSETIVRDEWDPLFLSTGVDQFARDILANRYYLQGSHAKAFLCHNSANALEINLNYNLITDIEEFLNQSNKNDLEEKLVKNFAIDNWQDKLLDLKGTYFLQQANPEKALAFFNQISSDYAVYVYEPDWSTNKRTFKKVAFDGQDEWDGYGGISKNIFNQNLIECYNCDEKWVMGEDYTDGMDIPKTMNKRELSEILVRLENTGKGKGNVAAKANFLLGNFYFNITDFGYFRHIVHFATSNGNSYRFNNYYIDNYYWDYDHPKEKEPQYYYKYYVNNPKTLSDGNPSLGYMKKALEQSTSDELSALICFGAAKAEQANYYNEYIQLVKNYTDWNWESRERKMSEIKQLNYRNYFRYLRNYEGTDNYKRIKSHCKYFQHYLTKN